MKEIKDILHSALIVSASPQVTEFIQKTLSGRRIASVESRKTAALARRFILERYTNLVIINAPLPDETGTELALDIVETGSAGVLIISSQEFFEDAQDAVTSQGVVVVSKPITRGRLGMAVDFLLSFQDRLQRLELKLAETQEKLEDMRVISRAKVYLVERMHMTEDEAHRFIGRQAMDSGVSRRRAAEILLEDESL